MQFQTLRHGLCNRCNEFCDFSSVTLKLPSFKDLIVQEVDRAEDRILPGVQGGIQEQRI